MKNMKRVRTEASKLYGYENIRCFRCSCDLMINGKPNTPVYYIDKGSHLPYCPNCANPRTTATKAIIERYKKVRESLREERNLALDAVYKAHEKRMNTLNDSHEIIMNVIEKAQRR